MNILYDGEIFSLQPFGGVNRYFHNLISRLPDNFNPIVITSSNKASIPKHQNLKQLYFPRFVIRPGRLAFFLEKLYFKYMSKLANCDVIHPTYYYLLLGHHAKSLKRPIVVTLYDLLHEIFPDTVDPNGHHSLAKSKVLSMASHIVCISERTRRDLLEYYPQYENRASVIPLAPDPSLSEAVTGERPIEDPYFLHVGQRWSYKNFPCLVSAFRSFSIKFPEVKLVITGPPLEPTERAILKERQLEKSVYYRSVSSDEELSTLYRHSLALIYPSLYEGLGLPPLEAMSCGAAVICSSASALPETVGDAAYLFDPRSVGDLANALEQVYTSSALRASLVERGHERVKLFSQERMVQRTVDIYRSL